jgi:hypothetical protein
MQPAGYKSASELSRERPAIDCWADRRAPAFPAPCHLGFRSRVQGQGQSTAENSPSRVPSSAESTRGTARTSPRLPSSRSGHHRYYDRRRRRTHRVRYCIIVWISLLCAAVRLLWKVLTSESKSDTSPRPCHTVLEVPGATVCYILTHCCHRIVELCNCFGN